MGNNPNIYDQGSAAYQGGVPLSNNPHKEGTANHLRWSLGWNDACYLAQQARNHYPERLAA